ncbi:MAG: hypothetical protein ACREJ2_02690, partial [Planctomycetota bacterium]
MEAMQLKADASRANAQLSTGPKTEAGKAASALNALKRGWSSTRAVLPGEDPAEFLAFKEEYVEGWRPATMQERMLSEQLATLEWRRQRLELAETETLDEGMASAPEGCETLLAHAFTVKHKELSLLVRYQG